MNKQIAMSTIRFLDRVSIKGHKERTEMNTVCDALLAVVNAEPVKETDDEADSK